MMERKGGKTGPLLLVLTLGVFSIINTEMGVVGILPMVSARYGVEISAAGLLVSLFALAVAVSGPILPLLFSRFRRKAVMLAVLGVFTACNVVSAFAESFPVLLTARILPAFFQPVYVSMAFSLAAASVEPSRAPKAVAKVMMGVSAGMVLGVPVVSAIAGAASLRAAMLFLAAANGVSLLAVLFFLPALPAAERVTYGSQVRVLKRSGVWLSILGVVLLNGSIFGVYSYLSEYLGAVTGLPAQLVSVLLLLYGLANILGNAIGGRALFRSALRFVVLFPPVLGAVYLLLLWGGKLPAPAVGAVLLWGILAGCAGNINQYWITAAAPEAPEFANGLFLSATNLGTTVGATLCGALIDSLGASSLPLGGLLMLAAGTVLLLLRARQCRKNPVFGKQEAQKAVS